MRSFLAVGFALLLLAVLGGCGPAALQDQDWRDESVELVWPPPPDPPRIKYLQSFSGPDDFADETPGNTFFTWLLGKSQDDLPLLTPFSVAADGAGRIWIADTGSRMLLHVDLSRERIDYYQEVADNRLTTPSGVAYDAAARRVFLADAAQDLIYVLDEDGNLLDRWGPPGGFQRPAGMALDGAGRLYVADVLKGTVAVFAADGRFLRDITSAVSFDGKFNRPLNVAIGPNEEVLILDSMAFRVEVQDRDGRLLNTIGRPGDTPGSFARPKGLAVSSQGYVCVSDAAFDNIQVFDLAGNLLLYFGGNGGSPGYFNLPAGLFIDANDRIYAADSYNHRIQVFQFLKQP